MQGRPKAFIITMFLNIPILVSIFYLEDILAVSVLLVCLISATFLLGFFFSPDARPPRIPPRSQTAKPVLLPLGFSGLTIAINLATGTRPVTYYLDFGYLAIIGTLTVIWLLGSFLARRMDSFYEPKSKKWLDAWDRYQIQKKQEREELEQDL